jgi:hypothetical protein
MACCDRPQVGPFTPPGCLAPRGAPRISGSTSSLGAPHPPHGRARSGARFYCLGRRSVGGPPLVVAGRRDARPHTWIGEKGCRGWVSRGLTQTRAPDQGLVPGEVTVRGNAGGVGGGRRLSVDKAVDTARAAAVDPAVWQASSRSAWGSADQQVTRGSSPPAWRNPSSAWHAGGYRRCPPSRPTPSRAPPPAARPRPAPRDRRRAPQERLLPPSTSTTTGNRRRAMTRSDTAS